MSGERTAVLANAAPFDRTPVTRSPHPEGFHAC